MKKIVLFAAVAAAMGLASCTGQAPKANLKSDVDSLSYMIGVTQGEGLKDVITTQLGIDSAYVADFIKGVQEGIQEGMPVNDAKAKALFMGKQIGMRASVDMYDYLNGQVFGKESATSLGKDNFLAGFIIALQNKAGIPASEAQMYVQTKEAAIKAKALEEQFGENKAAGEKFLAENKTKEGVKTTESGLQYKVIKEGKGAIPTKTDKVKVHYKGTLIDGTEFDSSYKRNAPASFRADQVIKGWTEALTMMPVGSKWELYIPQELAYGARETGGQIKPFSTLIFEVELLEIEKKK